MSPSPEQLPPIVYRSYIRSPPDKVFETLATGEGWNAWFTDEAEIDPQEGGRYRFRWRDFGPDGVTEALEGPVLTYDPGSCFAFEWESGESITTVRFTLEGRGGGTVVTVEEEGYGFGESDLVACLDCACGWGEALTLLKFYLEHGVTYGMVPEA